MTDESAFQAALDANPKNSEMRLVFADWLEEQGDWRAAGYRWMGVNGKSPRIQVISEYHPIDKPYYLWCIDSNPWAQSDLEKKNDYTFRSPWSGLPKEIFDKIPQTKGPNIICWRYYKTRTEAEEAVCCVFVDHPDLIPASLSVSQPLAFKGEELTNGIT